MLTKWAVWAGLGIAASLGVVGCDGGSATSSGDTAGDLIIDENQGTGAGGSGGSDGGGGTGGTNDTTSSGPPTLQSVCEAGCHEVETLSVELGCNPTPNCVGDCVDYGNSVGSCLDEYVDLMDCAGQEMSAETCNCSSQSGGILACNLCPGLLSTFQSCLDPWGMGG